LQWLQQKIQKQNRQYPFLRELSRPLALACQRLPRQIVFCFLFVPNQPHIPLTGRLSANFDLINFFLVKWGKYDRMALGVFGYGGYVAIE
jgi:hypothetical protein